MILNYTEKPENYPKSIVTIANQVIENVKVFKYLGVKLDFQQYDTGSTEIKYRINCSNFKFREMKHVFENQSISLQTSVVSPISLLFISLTLPTSHVRMHLGGATASTHSA